MFVDATLIVQVLANLLDNAAKYTPAGTRDHGDGGRRGRGGADHDRRQRRRVCRAGDPERLFDKFQRGIQEGTIVGVGLGLSICRAIVEAHGGSIAARARPGGGARLTFTLPTAEPGA